MPVLEYLRAGPYVRAHELRLMFIGDGEVGKTRLFQAFFAEEYKAKHANHEPTIGIDFKPWVFPSSDSEPAVTCQLCDFAGQESYYLSHSLHFSRRSLYLLMWTPYKFSVDGAPRLLAIADIVGPLKRWLQLLSDNVPEANVVVVGTHYSVNPDAFEALRTQVDREIVDEIDRLGFIADRQAPVTRKVLETQEAKVHDIFTKLTSSHLPIRAPALELAEIAQFCDAMDNERPKPKRSLLLQAKSLLEACRVAKKTKRRLSRMYGLYDGSVPSHTDQVAPHQVAHLKLVSSSQDSFKSFVVDSIEGVGVAELLRAIEATCRNPGALPFMGEQIPVSWLQVKAALQLRPVHTALGDSVLSVADAVAKLNSVLKTELSVDVGLARCLDSRSLQSCIVDFWSPLGEVFVHDGHFLRDPCLIIDFLKPLVHHDVQSIAFWRDFCIAEHDGSLDEDLAELQERAVLDHRLFSVVEPWASASTSARDLMLSFFKDCYMISSFDDEGGRASSHSKSLVTARLCESSNSPRQSEMREKIAFIAASFQFHAVYVVPVEHIGIMARLQAMIERLRPREIHLDVAFGDKDVCISRGLVAEINRRRTELLFTLDRIRGCVQGLDLTNRYNANSPVEDLESVYESLGSDAKKQFPASPRRVADGCCVSMRSLGDVRKTRLSSLCDKVPKDQYSHALVVSSTNDGLFAFAAQCIDEIVRSCAFGSVFQSWLPCRPPEFAGGTSWTPVKSDWAQLGTEKLNPKSLSEVLSANANDIVLESHKRRLKDILPRKPPIFMSHTSSGHDGTHEFCQRLKDKLQKKLLCSVWFDENELKSSGSFIQEMQVGMRNASFFVICLTPLYLTRPNCLRELRWALDMCSAEDSTKKMIVLPLHPAVSLQGCEDIIKANRDGRPAHVFLPVDDRTKVQPTSLEHLKGHKLSCEAIKLLERLTQTQSFDVDSHWIKLQPWRSDELGEDWEEESVSWAEERPAEVDTLLDGSLSEILVCMATSHPSAAFEFFNYQHQDLVSIPPSLECLIASDVFAIRSCYPRSEIVFSEQELVSLVHLGLSDADIMGCVEHGLGKLSAIETATLDGQFVYNPNPLHATCRTAAHMSGVNFQEAREKWLNYNDMKNTDGRNRDPGLKGDLEHQNFCKALMMFEKAAAAVVPRITSELISLHSDLLPLVLRSKPQGENEFVWKQSDHALKVWETSLLANHRNKEARRDEKGGFFVNVPDKSLLWSPSDGPHQIAKVYCSEGARLQSRIDDLDAAKLFNILLFCTRFSSEVRDAAVHCNPCRNISAHTKKSAMKLAQKEYDVIFKCICKLLECLNDRPSHIAATEIRELYAEQWQMLNIEVVNRMKQENERLRTQVTYLQGAKSSGSFSLRVLEAHALKVVPDFSKPQRFTCMVNVVTGPVEVGMSIAGAAVSAGSVLTSASGLSVGFISNLSISKSEDSPKNPGTPKLIYTPQAFATARQDVLVDIIVTDPREFTFPSLSDEAARYVGLVRKIADASASSADDGTRLRLSGIIAKLEEKPPKKLSNDDVEFCRKACSLSVEEYKLLPSNLVAASPSAGNASPAVDKTLPSAKSRVPAKSKVAGAGGGGKGPKPDSKPSDPSPSDEESKLLPSNSATPSPSAAAATDNVSSSAKKQAPLPSSPVPSPLTLSDSATSAPALAPPPPPQAPPPPPQAAARPERTLAPALVQRSDAKWEPDDSRDKCAVCSEDFTWLLLRRHHCRFYGKVMCDGCAPERAQAHGHADVRCCKGCLSS